MRQQNRRAADGLDFKVSPITAKYIFIAGGQPAVALPFIAMEANLDGLGDRFKDIHVGVWPRAAKDLCAVPPCGCTNYVCRHIVAAMQFSVPPLSASVALDNDPKFPNEPRRH